jgi:hypothetical protein
MSSGKFSGEASDGLSGMDILLHCKLYGLPLIGPADISSISLHSIDYAIGKVRGIPEIKLLNNIFLLLCQALKSIINYSLSIS